MPPSSIITLAVGARYACFHCRDRSPLPGRCQRCGRMRYELREHHRINSRLVKLARRVHKANDAQRHRDRALSWISHLVGVVFSALSVCLVLHHPGGVAGQQWWVVLVASMLGYAVGMLSVALFLVLIWLSTAALALLVSLAILSVSLALSLASYTLPKAAGRNLRQRITRRTERWIATVFAPVFRLRGHDRSQCWVKRRRHEGLRPTTLSLPAPGAPALRFEGVIAGCPEQLARIGDERGAIVGVAGYTVGVRVQDALVAPFVVDTPEGSVRVEMDVGEVVFATAQCHPVLLSESELPTQWGIGRTKRRLDTMPMPEPVAVFIAAPGSSVVIEGGQWSDRASVSDHDGYRHATFERTVRGTVEHPLRVTVVRNR